MGAEGVTDQTSGEQPSRQRQIEQLSSQELEFLQRWRLLIDRLGGQARASETMGWTTSTVSRDYTGLTLPSDDRLREIFNYFKLPNDERTELKILLRQARGARKLRLKNGSGSPDSASSAPQSDPAPGPDPALRTDSAHRRWIIAASIATVVVVVVVVVAGMLALSPGQSKSAQSGVQGTYPGGVVKTVSIPMKSLTPSLVTDFRKGRTAQFASVTGFEFRNAQDPALCLTAADTGPSAGRNRGQVKVAACQATPNQIWIPEQWEINGSAFTHLVSARYQKECLNVRKTGGAMRDGNATMLWTCYKANNESWDFGDWYRNVRSGQRSYPMLMHTDRFCLDVSDTYGTSDEVDIRVQRVTPNQFWS